MGGFGHGGFDPAPVVGPQGPPGAPGVVQSVVAGAGTTVDDTDPANPIVAAQWGAAATAKFSYAGDPNGHVTALAEGDLCVDSSTPALYQAPGAGTVWTQIGAGGGQWGAAATAQFSYAGDPNDNVTADANGDLCVDTTTPGVWQWDDNEGYWHLITPMFADGSPIDNSAVPAAPYCFYVDTQTLAVYFAVGTTDTDWVLLGGQGDNVEAAGVRSTPGSTSITDGSVAGLAISSGVVTLEDTVRSSLALDNIGNINASPGITTGKIQLNGYLSADSGVTVTDDGAGNSLVSVHNATPVAQAAVIPAPTGGAIIDAEARTAITAILNALGAAAGGIGITA